MSCGEWHPQQVVKVWTFSISDITNLIPRLKIQNSTKFYLFTSFWCSVNNVLFIQGHFRGKWEGAAPASGQVWKFFTSDITCLFSTPKYGGSQSSTRSSLFVITIFIFGHSGHTRGQLTATSGLKFINFYFWYHQWIPCT